MNEKHINYKILLVDDDLRFHKDFREVFGGIYEIYGAVSGPDMWEKLGSKNKYDLLALDLKLDGKSIKSGQDLIGPIIERYPDLPIIVITADETIYSALDSMKLGAKSFLSKQDEDYKYWKTMFREVIRNSHAEAEIERLKKGDATKKSDFIGVSKAMMEIRERLELLSQNPHVTVLLTGETGVGKDAAANFMHSCSKRRDKPFIPVNLSAVNKSLMESELFGAVKGAFTGSLGDKKGYFEEANGGILMLDEIGDIEHDIQVKLLRFFDHKVIRPVGGKADISLDLQIVAATNKNLDNEVQKGTFREDLRYRMKYKIEIPPLRNRKEDIIPIFNYLITKKHHLDPDRHLIPEISGKLLQYDWPGNVRQLGNLVDAMVLERSLFKKDIIDMACFESAFENVIPRTSAQIPVRTTNISTQVSIPASNNSSQDRKLEKAIDDMQQIEVLLKNPHYKKTAVAQMLGFKGLDHMRARIKTCYQNYPEIFDNLPTIKSTYL